MSKATVLLNVAAYSKGQADQVSAANYYDEVIFELGRSPWLTNFTIVGITAGNNNVQLALTTIDLHGAIYGNLWLTEMPNLREAESVQQDWRDVLGGPIAYSLEGADHLDLILFPTPIVSGLIAPLRFDKAYPDYNLVPLYTEYRATVPLWFEYVVTFGVLEREYQRSSDHMDPDAVEAAKQLGNFLKVCVA